MSALSLQGQVYLVDDDPSILRSTTRFLRAHGFRVTAFQSPLEFLAHPLSDEPGCIVLDLQMPDLTGLEVQERLRAAGTCLPVIFLTGQGDIPLTVQAMRQGAEDFLPKTVPQDRLLETIRRAIARCAAERQERIRLAAIKARFDRLSFRERQVLERVLAGHLNKQIAADLGMDERTVKRHRANSMDKLGVQSLPEATRLAHEAGFPATAAEGATAVKATPIPPG